MRRGEAGRKKEDGENEERGRFKERMRRGEAGGKKRTEEGMRKEGGKKEE